MVGNGCCNVLVSPSLQWAPLNPLLHTACRLQITTGANIGKVCSEELLESHLVPQLITSKSESRGNQNRDEQQPPKVSNYGLSACMVG